MSEPLITLDDLRARTGEDITEEREIKLADTLIKRASASVRAAARQAWPDPATAPDNALTIALEAASRGYLNPAYWDTERADAMDFGRSDIGANGIELTKSEKAELFQLRPRSVGSIAVSPGVPLYVSDHKGFRVRREGAAPDWHGMAPWPLGNDQSVWV